MFWLQQNLLQDYKDEKDALKGSKKTGMKSLEEDPEKNNIEDSEFVEMMGERHKIGKINDKQRNRRKNI